MLTKIKPKQYDFEHMYQDHKDPEAVNYGLCLLITAAKKCGVNMDTWFKISDITKTEESYAYVKRGLKSLGKGRLGSSYSLRQGGSTRARIAGVALSSFYRVRSQKPTLHAIESHSYVMHRRVVTSKGVVTTKKVEQGNGYHIEYKLSRLHRRDALPLPANEEPITLAPVPASESEIVKSLGKLLKSVAEAAAQTSLSVHKMNGRLDSLEKSMNTLERAMLGDELTKLQDENKQLKAKMALVFETLGPKQ